MAQWYVKDLSKLTHISVQTLHHYDRIGLLNPSVRLANGYRLYSEKDLLTLQQIIALKFFGFELSQIKQLLAAEMNVVEHFAAQSQFLEEKAKAMQEASNALKAIIANCEQQQSIQWETIIKLIEVYRMTRELEKTWAGKVLNSQELKDYAKFEQELPARFTKSEKEECERNWNQIVNDVETNLHEDPASHIGIEIGKRCMEWVTNLYGKEYVALRTAIWEKGFKGGHGADQHGLSAASVAWLDKAMKAYYEDRVKNILHAATQNPDGPGLQLWNDLVHEVCGDNKEKTNSFIEAVMNSEKISKAEKDWLKKICR